MGMCSRMLVLLAAVLALVCLTSRAGAQVVETMEEQKNIFIELPHGLYAFAQYARTAEPDAFTITDMPQGGSGKVGWQGSIRGFFFDIGTEYPLWSNMGEIGSIIKPYARLSRDFTVFRKHSLRPSIRFDATLPVLHTSETSLDYTMGLQHRWDPYDFLHLEQGVNFHAHEQTVHTGSYYLNTTWQLSKDARLEFPRLYLEYPLDDMNGLSPHMSMSVRFSMKF